MNRIYSATYSNVPVYEYSVDGTQVMRRRADSWINATHILKVADYDKPARTRILEREVQKNTHEKVQGGYGKYQGTWIPLEEGRKLAERCGCLEKLIPILEFVPGDRSPPPAPKHQTAAASRPKAPRPSAANRKSQGKGAGRKTKDFAKPTMSKDHEANHHSRMSEASFDRFSQPQMDDNTSAIDQVTVTSDSEGEAYDNAYGSRKRKRGAEQPQVMSAEDQQHLLWSDELLDYFMLQRDPEPGAPQVPIPPSDIDLNRAIDEKGNTALHWAAAMGDIHLVAEFVRLGAKVDALTASAITPLMHAVTFTNNADKQTMGRLVEYLYTTVGQRDCCFSTVFHHIVASTMSKSKYPVARYYLECILDRLKHAYDQRNIATLLDLTDSEGNTATLLAAKFGARKCVRLLTLYGASTSIANKQGETAETYIRELNERRRDRQRQGSSSPILQPSGQTHHDLPSLSLHPPSSSQNRAQQFASEAASLLASQLPVLITSRTEALATALETELSERDAEAREAERLLQQRRQELYILRQRTSTLRGQDVDDAVDEAQRAELEELMVESRRLLEAEQSDALKRLINEAESALNASHTSMDAESPHHKLSLARQLQAAQTQRKHLVAEIVAAQGLAGASGARQEAYKRLITSALGVRSEDVEFMLPEMLAELEEAHAGVDLSPVENGVLDGHVQQAPLLVQS